MYNTIIFQSPQDTIIFLIYFQLKDNCFTVLHQFLLYNSVNQQYVYKYPLPSQPPDPHPISVLQVITEPQAELPVLYGRFLLAICFTHGSVYICQCYSFNLSHPLLPPLCPQVLSLHLCLYSCPSNRFVSTIFINSIYMC